MGESPCGNFPSILHHQKITSQSESDTSLEVVLDNVACKQNLDHLHYSWVAFMMSTMEKLTAICIGKRAIFIPVTALCIAMLIVAFVLSVFSTVKIVKSSTTKENKWNSAKDEIKRKVNESLRVFVSTQIGIGIDKIKQIKTKNTNLSNPGFELRQSFKDMQDHMNSLIFSLGNLSTVVLKMNSSSDSKLSLLRRNLNDTRNTLISMRNELTQLNDSVHTEMVHFVVTSVNNLRQELTILRNSTATIVTELRKHWDRTDAEIEDIIKLMVQQNETLHFKIAYHSDVLYSKVKYIENKQSKFHNDTHRNLKKLRGELNQTRSSLQKKFENQILWINKTWYEALEDINGYFRSSMNKINKKIAAIKEQFQTNITGIVNQQNEIKREFAKTKAGFQENDRKHHSAISGQAQKMNRMEKRIEDLEENLDSKTRKMKTLEQKVQNLEKGFSSMTNKASRVPGTGSYFLVILGLFQIYVYNIYS